MFAPKATDSKLAESLPISCGSIFRGLLSVFSRIRVPPTSRGALSSKAGDFPLPPVFGRAEDVYASFADFEAHAGKPAPVYAGPV